MRISFFVLLFYGLSIASFAQIARDFTINGQIDLIKTDNDNFLRKAQFGAEANYFITDRITVLSGLELWTGERLNLIIGSRWYPKEEAFIRLRGILGENDISLGGGWTKPINENFKFEAIGDFYFKIDFAIRVGLVFVIPQ